MFCIFSAVITSLAYSSYIDLHCLFPWMRPFVYFMSSQMSRNVRKRTLEHVRPAEIHISLRIRAGWSEFSLSAFWIAKDAKFFFYLRSTFQKAYFLTFWLNCIYQLSCTVTKSDFVVMRIAYDQITTENAHAVMLDIMFNAYRFPTDGICSNYTAYILNLNILGSHMPSYRPCRDRLINDSHVKWYEDSTH